MKSTKRNKYKPIRPKNVKDKVKRASTLDKFVDFIDIYKKSIKEYVKAKNALTRLTEDFEIKSMENIPDVSVNHLLNFSCIVDNIYALTLRDFSINSTIRNSPTKNSVVLSLKLLTSIIQNISINHSPLARCAAYIVEDRDNGRRTYGNYIRKLFGISIFKTLKSYFESRGFKVLDYSDAITHLEEKVNAFSTLDMKITKQSISFNPDYDNFRIKFTAINPSVNFMVHNCAARRVDGSSTNTFYLKDFSVIDTEINSGLSSFDNSEIMRAVCASFYVDGDILRVDKTDNSLQKIIKSIGHKRKSGFTNAFNEWLDENNINIIDIDSIILNPESHLNIINESNNVRHFAVDKEGNQTPIVLKGVKEGFKKFFSDTEGKSHNESDNKIHKNRFSFKEINRKAS